VRNGLTQQISLQIILNSSESMLPTNAKFIEIVTFLVILTFQLELGKSTATLALADLKTMELRQNSGAQHYE
jgi:hypothetical protein